MKETSMLMAAFSVLVSAALTVMPNGPSGASDRAQASRPNVLVIITDDQGYPDLSCHGHPDLRTPHLDRLHAESVRLTDYHVDPTCSPTRAALMTGRWSTRTGVWHTIMGRSLMHPDEQTMAELLRAAGWRTAMFGKWHLGDAFPCRPQDQGFEQGLVHGGGGVGQTPDWYGNDYFDDTYFGFMAWAQAALPADLPRDRLGLPTKVEGYCTDVWFDACRDFILQEDTRPFFAYLSTNVAHYPANVAEKYWKPFAERGVEEGIARCYGMVANLDENIGRLLHLLDGVGLSKNTLVVFTTDNGSAFSKGFPGDLRSQKGSEYDGGHRVPFFARWPKGGVGGGRDVDALCAHVDVLPTILELCDVAPVDPPAVDGVSLADALQGRGEAPGERTLFVHSQRIEHPKKWRKSAVMTKRWRLVNGTELFDMAADPRQEHDLAEKHPAVVKELRVAYEVWWKDLEPSFAIEVAMGLGDPRANPTRLTCHDWRSGKVPWNQGHVANRQVANGEWVVEVMRAGRYRFTLRERPPESAAPLAATFGEVWIAGVHGSAEVGDGAEAVDLVLELPAGRSRLRTALHGTDGKTRGAYFVTVEALSTD